MNIYRLSDYSSAGEKVALFEYIRWTVKFDVSSDLV